MELWSKSNFTQVKEREHIHHLKRVAILLFDMALNRRRQIRLCCLKDYCYTLYASCLWQLVPLHERSWAQAPTEKLKWQHGGQFILLFPSCRAFWHLWANWNKSWLFLQILNSSVREGRNFGIKEWMERESKRKRRFTDP